MWPVNLCLGNFFSAAFENPCMAIVGASGGVFGMIGLYLGDMVMNFRSISRCGCDWSRKGPQPLLVKIYEEE